MKNTQYLPSSLNIFALVGALLLALASPVRADGTWAVSTGSNNWTTSADWVGSAIPGATTGTTDTETATFNGGTAAQTITIDANRNLENFTFNLALGTFGYTLSSAGTGNSALTLSNNGNATLNGNSASQVVSFYTTTNGGNTNILNLEGNYTFTANTGFFHLTQQNAVYGQLTEHANGTLTLGGNSGVVAPNQVPGIYSTYNFISLNLNQSSSTLNVLKTSTGAWMLAGPTSNYTGTTTIDGGVLNVSSLANEGTASSIGEGHLAGSSGGVGSAGDLVINGGELQYYGFGPFANSTPLSTPAGFSTNRLFTIGDGDTSAGTANTAQIDSSNPWLANYGSSQDTISFTNAGAIVFNDGGTSGAGANTLTLSGLNIGNNVFNPQLTDNSAGGVTSLIKSGTGTWIMGGSNTYTGNTTVNGGVLDVVNASALSSSSTLILTSGVYQGNGTMNRSLGSTAGAGNIEITGGQTGLGAYNGNLNVTIGTANSVLQFGSSTFNPSALILNGPTATGTLTLNNGLDLNGATRLIFADAGTAIINGAIVNNATGATAGLSKSGAGVLELTASNSFNGLTGVSGGVLWAGGTGTLGTNTGVINVGGGGELRLDSTAALPGTVLLNHGTLGVNFNASQAQVNGMLNSASVGVVALDGTNSNAFNLNTLGNSNLFLGSSTVGTYTASTLGVAGGGTALTAAPPTAIAAFGGSYNLGGGGGTLIFTGSNVLTDQPGAYLGTNPTNALFTQGNGNSPSTPVTYTATSNTRNNVVIGDGSTAGQPDGGGTVDFQARQGYTGTTTINAGATLNLDFSNMGSGNNDIINSANQVVLQGGTVEMTGAATGANSQTLGGVSATIGSSTIEAIGSTATLNTGTVSGNAGAIVDFLGNNGGTIKAANTSLNTGQFVYTNGVGGTTSFATNSGANTSVGALSGQSTSLATATNNSTTDYIMTNTAVLIPNSTINAMINTLTISSTTGVTLTLGASDTLAVNGILDNSTGGTVTITAGTIKVGANGNLYINNYAPNSSLGSAYATFTSQSQAEGAGTLFINSGISGSGNVIFGGTGAISVASGVSNTGNVYLDGATLIQDYLEVAPTGTFVINSGALAMSNQTSNSNWTVNQQWNGNFTLFNPSAPTQAFNGGGVTISTGKVTLTNNITVTMNTDGMDGEDDVAGTYYASLAGWTYTGIMTDNGYGYGLTVGANSPNPTNPNGTGFQNLLNTSLELNGTAQFTGPITVLGDSIWLAGASSTDRNNVLQLAPNTTAYIGANITLAGLQDVGAPSSTEIISAGPGGGTDNTTSTNVSLNLFGGGNYSFGGVIQDVGTNTYNGSVGTGKTSLAMDGTGTQTLTNSNSFTGAVTVNAGELILDASQLAGTPVLSGTNANALTVAGGTFAMKGATVGTTQSVSSTTTGIGGSTITVDNNGGTAGATVLNLGALTASAVGVTLDVVAANTAPSSTTAPTITTTSANNSVGTLGTAGRVVYTAPNGAVSWATGTTNGSGSNNIGAYTLDTTALVTAGGGALTANNYLLTASQTQTATTTASLLRITNTTAGSLNLAGQSLIVANTGVLFNGTASYSITGGGAFVGGASDKELIINNYGTGTGTTLTINAPITNNGSNVDALIISGPGTTVLGGSNTYSGLTYLNNGTINFNKLANFGAGAGITISGATLQYATGNTQDMSSGTVASGGSGKTITIDDSGATIDTNGNSMTYASTFGTGSGGVTFVDSASSHGTLNFNSSSGYTGFTTIGSGANVNLGGTGTFIAGTNALAGTIVANGGTLSGGVTQATQNVQSTGAMAGNITLQSGGVLAPGNLTILGAKGVNGIQGEGTGDGAGNQNTSVTNNVLNATQLTWNAGGQLKFFLDNTSQQGTILAPSPSTLLNLGTGALVKGGGTGGYVLNFQNTGNYNTGGLSTGLDFTNVYDLINFGGTSLIGGLNGNTNFNIDDFSIVNLDGVGTLSFYYNAAGDNGAGQEELLLTVVPEPSTWAMLLGGLVALVFWTRKRSRRTASPRKA